MKMPFSNLTLLDYAVNSTLVLANVCLQKQDRVGVMTFANKMSSLLAADRKPIQRENVLQLLYNQQTAFLESISSKRPQRTWLSAAPARGPVRKVGEPLSHRARILTGRNREVNFCGRSARSILNSSASRGE